MSIKVGLDIAAHGIAPMHVVVFVVRHTPDGARYLLMRRCSSYLRGYWQMVTGGIHKGETAVAAAVRELKEETGIVADHMYSADVIENFYDSRQDCIVFAPVFFVRVAPDCLVTLAPKEHDKYEWLEYSDAKARLEFSGQREAVLSNLLKPA